MTAQLATALKRSFGTALPVAILVAAAVAVQFLFPGNAAGKEALTAALGAAATVIPILTRGLVEGLSDGQRAAIGKVVNSDVAPQAVNAAAVVAAPEIVYALKSVGVNVTDAQVVADVNAAEKAVKSNVASDLESVATVTHSTQPAPAAVAPEPPATPLSPNTVLGVTGVALPTAADTATVNVPAPK